jgi:hypothetical protein
MISQLVAELSELSLPLILKAELEGLLGNVVIQPLHPGIGPQQLEALAVGLPEELDPGHEDGAVGAVLGPLARHGREHDHLGGGQVVQIVHLHAVHALLPRRLCPLLGQVQVTLSGNKEQVLYQSKTKLISPMPMNVEFSFLNKKSLVVTVRHYQA